MHGVPELIFTLRLPITGAAPIPVQFYKEEDEIWFNEPADSRFRDHPIFALAQDWEKDNDWVVTRCGHYLYNLDRELLYDHYGSRHELEYPDMDIETQWWLINELMYNRHQTSYAGQNALELARIYIKLMKSGSQEADRLMEGFLEKHKMKRKD